MSNRLLSLLCFVVASQLALADGEIAKLASSGLIVHVGALDTRAAQSIVADKPVLLLIVASDKAAEERLRAELVSSNLHGQVTVAALLPGSRIPLADNLASLVIAGLDARPTPNRDELLRITRPLGKLHLRQSNQWQTHTKPRPETHGDWGQYHFDATMSDVGDDRAAGPAFGIQWLAGPQEASQQGVRVVGDVLVQPERRNREQCLVARDASSGLPLWMRSDLGSVSRYALLLDDRHVYLYPQTKDNRPAPAMVALDRRTGKTVIEYSEGITFNLPEGLGTDTRKIDQAAKPLREKATDFQARLLSDALLQIAGGDLVVLDALTGKRRWSANAAEGCVFMHPVMAGGKVFVFEGAKAPSYSYTHWPNITTQSLKCFGLADGKPAWSLDWPRDRQPAAAYNLTIAHGKLAAAVRMPAGGKGKVHALIVDAATGREDFFGTNDVFKGEIGGGHSSARALAIGDRLWFTTIVSIGGSMSLTHPADKDKIDLSYAKLVRPVGCTAFRATSHWLFGSLTTYSLDGKQVFHTDAARTACDVGAFPAGGLSYITANHCFCQPYMPGTVAFHSRPFTDPEALERLERGPAQASAPAPNQPRGWPMFLADNARSAWSDEKLAPQLKQLWSIKPAGDTAPPSSDLLARSWAEHWYAHGPLSQPSVAEGIAVVALAHRQQVVGLDPATGKEKWRTPVDGRVDSAPTLYKGLVIFGTRSGWVYALQRDSGQLVWRFFAAPRRQRIVVDGQLESPWPLFGTLSVDDKGIYAVAGRHTDADGGLFWYQLNLDGAVLAQGRIGQNQLKSTTYGGQNPGQQQATGANSPAVMTDDRYLMAGVHLARTDKGLEPWFGLFPPPKNWESDFWKIRHDAKTLVPGNQGLLARVDFLGGYKLTAYAFTQARFYAHKGDDFVMVGGAPALQHRGGDSDSELRRMKRLPEVLASTRPHPKPTEKPIRITKGAEVVWEIGEPLARGNGATALAVAGDTVLFGIEVTNRDRHRERQAMAYRLQLLNLADGTIRQELALPAPPIFGGIAIANGRVYVTTSDGSLTCFGAP